MGEEQRQRHFATGEIRAERFAGDTFGAEHVQAVVENLVRRAEGDAEASERIPLGRGGPGDDRPQFAGHGEKFRGLQANDTHTEVLIQGLVHAPFAQGLQDLAGTDRLGGRRDRAADFGGWKRGRQMQGMGEKAIAKEDRRLIAVTRGHGKGVVGEVRGINDIVVNERRQVDQFDDGGAGCGQGAIPPAAFAPKATETGRNCLPLADRAFARLRRLQARIGRSAAPKNPAPTPGTERQGRRSPATPWRAPHQEGRRGVSSPGVVLFRRRTSQAL